MFCFCLTENQIKCLFSRKKFLVVVLNSTWYVLCTGCFYCPFDKTWYTKLVPTYFILLQTWSLSKLSILVEIIAVTTFLMLMETGHLSTSFYSISYRNCDFDTSKHRHIEDTRGRGRQWVPYLMRLGKWMAEQNDKRV